mgnify:CR=1 FL=1
MIQLTLCYWAWELQLTMLRYEHNPQVNYQESPTDQSYDNENNDNDNDTNSNGNNYDYPRTKENLENNIPPEFHIGSIDKLKSMLEEIDCLSERKYSIESSSSISTELSHEIDSGFESGSFIIEPTEITSTTTVTTSRVRFSLPSMEFVWETDPSGESTLLI